MDTWTHQGKFYRLCRLRRLKRDPLADPSEPPDEVHFNVIQSRMIKA